MSICTTNNQQGFIDMLEKMQQDPTQQPYAVPNISQEEEDEFLVLNKHVQNVIEEVFHDKNVSFIVDKINDIIKTSVEPKLQEFIDTIVQANNTAIGTEYSGFTYKDKDHLLSSNNTGNGKVAELDPTVEASNMHLLEFITNYKDDMKNISSYLHTLYNTVNKVNMMIGLLPEYYQITIEHHVTNIPPVDFIFESYPTIKRDLWEDLINNKLTFYTAYAKII